MIWFAAQTPPEGFLECNGSILSPTTYPALRSLLGNAYGAYGQLPDLRGEFIRGWDHGKGADLGRIFGSWQADAFQSHTHTYEAGIDLGDAGKGNFQLLNKTQGISTTAAAGTASETRPRNTALLPCIKY